ncbi:MAG: glycosyltransferase [Paraclostridium sordellii]
MRLLYIAKIDEKYSLDFGVSKKIKGQIRAFQELGYEIDYLRMQDKFIIFNEDRLDKIKYRYFAYKEFYKVIKEQKRLKYDFVYLRYARGDIYFYKTIKMFNELSIKVITEIPTYPYENRLIGDGVKDTISGWVDMYLATKLKKYVYRISVTNTHEYIYGIKTVNINNGIDLKELPIIKKQKKQNECINMIGIANLAKWHGYDRVIYGLSEYYKNKNQAKDVNFYIIGDGSEKENLINITKQLNIKDKVHFLGGKSGKELDDIFNIMDIGISSLALFRAGGGHDPIKSKEFLGRGIPVVLGYEDKLIDMNLPYVLKVDENESYVDIDNIINEYEKCFNISESEIRMYADKFLSWKTQMKKVVDGINKK